MQPERAERIAEIVEQALEAEIGQRGPLLVELCGDDQELFVEVASLLHFQEKARDFIETPAVETVAELLADERAGLQPGDTLDRYNIVSLLGEGGMGEVYLAEEISLRRKVAIKLLKYGLGTASLVRHFQQEERILAGLTHPNIARLYGGAVTTNGLPYFVMEYVDGKRLDHYCRDNSLAISQRLNLFRKICSAVDYAHQRLVIHRDIKPANIRVTKDGEPKLLDFGIAKLLDPATAAIETTMTFAAVMTPEYASPEQVRGENITTTSDVYSLGVVLYELLTEQKPYKIDSRTPTAVSRGITEQEPTKPSIAVARRDGSCKSQIPSSKLLRGDLDNIVLKALRKEPERRYTSVSLFSEDIRRYLEGRPIIARKDTLGYRTSKFVARNKIAVAAAILIIVSLIGGMAATTIEAHRANQQRARAERRFNDVRKLANSLVFELHSAIENLPGSTAARALLVKRALEYLNSLAQEAAGDLSLQRELASAYVKVGNVQGDPNNANLGDTNGALKSYLEAQNISGQILSADPTDSEARRSLAICQEKMSDVQAAIGDIGAAVNSERKSLAIFKSLAERDAKNARAQRSLAISYIKMGDVLGNSNFPNAGDEAGATINYRASSTVWHALDQANPNNSDIRSWLGRIHERIGAILEQQGKIDAAFESYRESQTIREALAKENPQNTDVLRDVAIADEKMGNVMTALKNLTAALENRIRSLQIFKRLADADPRNSQAQQSLAISYIHLADLLGYPGAPNLGRRSEARENYQRARDILRREKDSGSTDAKVEANFDLIRERMSKL
jgi:non-specific serine/threonine protein kinase/serine/threonine-protein kinase